MYIYVCAYVCIYIYICIYVYGALINLVLVNYRVPSAHKLRVDFCT